MGEELDPTLGTQGEDPGTDSLEAPTGDSGENSPSDTTPIDWEARYKATQAELTRKATVLKQREDQLLRLSRGTPPADAQPDEGATLPPQVARELEELRQWRQQNEWEQATNEIGQPVADAYQVFYRGYQLDNTPKGALGAFVEAIQYLASQAPAGGGKAPKPTRSEAVTPRVDSNRSDAPDIADLDSKIEAAKAGKDTETPAQRDKRLTSFIGNSLKKAGISY